MTQQDVLLRFENLCSKSFTKKCDDIVSDTMLTKEVDMTPEEYWEYLVLHKVKKNIEDFITNCLKTTIANAHIDDARSSGTYALSECPYCKKGTSIITPKDDVFVCFSCDQHGTILDLIKEVKGVAKWSGYSRDFTDEQLKEVLKIAVPTDDSICTKAVPASCHRIKCFKKTSDSYESCRMLAFVLSQENESGFWLKLPCSMCDEETKLHEVTEAFVYDPSRNS